MKEQEYITARDLQRLETAERCLKDIVPDNSQIVEKEVLSQILIKLNGWIGQHYIEIKDEIE